FGSDVARRLLAKAWGDERPASDSTDSGSPPPGVPPTTTPPTSDVSADSLISSFASSVDGTLGFPPPPARVATSAPIEGSSVLSAPPPRDGDPAVQTHAASKEKPLKSSREGDGASTQRLSEDLSPGHHSHPTLQEIQESLSQPTEKTQHAVSPPG